MKLREWLIILLCAISWVVTTWCWVAPRPEPQAQIINATEKREYKTGYKEGFKRAMMFRSLMSDDDKAEILGAILALEK